MTIRRIGLPLLLALSIAGCANGAADPAGAPAAAPAASSSVPSAAPSSAVPSEESGTKPEGSGTKTLTGTIVAGVEPGCLILDNHLLILKDESLKSAAAAGASVTVTGQAQEGLMTTCQQGTPFLVTAIRPN